MKSAPRSWGSDFARPWTAAQRRVDRGAKPPAKCPAWTPAEGALLVIAAHPNDEILRAGGLIRSWAASAREVQVLSVSDGEAADPGCEGLASVRRGEVRDALRKLCPTHVSVTRLGLPDGRIAEHVNRLRNAMLSCCREPVTLIAPHENASHPDHQCVGALCVEFARSQNVPIARYPLSARTDLATVLPGTWVKFELSEEARRAKARAIDCFRSQTDGRLGEPPGAAHPGDIHRSYEAFIL